jgi:hypothetical protein
MIDWLMNDEWDGHGRKWSCPNLRHISAFGGLRKTTKILRVAVPRAET